MFFTGLEGQKCSDILAKMVFSTKLCGKNKTKDKKTNKETKKPLCDQVNQDSPLLLFWP